MCQASCTQAGGPSARVELAEPAMGQERARRTRQGGRGIKKSCPFRSCLANLSRLSRDGRVLPWMEVPISCQAVAGRQQFPDSNRYLGRARALSLPPPPNPSLCETAAGLSGTARCVALGSAVSRFGHQELHGHLRTVQVDSAMGRPEPPIPG